MNSPKILLIEDNDKDAVYAGNLLKEKGYNLLSVNNGCDALAKASQERFDLIILDLILPDIRGEEVCSLLRRKRSLRDTPIIVLSVKDEIDDVEELFRRGADDYIIKPPQPKHLLDKIETHINRRRKIY